MGLVGLVQSAVAMGIVAGIDMFKVHSALSLASLPPSKSLVTAYTDGLVRDLFSTSRLHSSLPTLFMLLSSR